MITTNCSIPANLTLSFNPGVKLVVGAGVTLTIETNTVLMNASSTQGWEGIVLEPNSKLFLKEGAKITHAKIGIDADVLSEINASGANFINNRVSVYASEAGQSHFEKCLFLWDNDFLFSYFTNNGNLLNYQSGGFAIYSYIAQYNESFSHVFLKNCSNSIIFKGNVFDNLIDKSNYISSAYLFSTSFIWQARGVGIVSQKSSLYLNSLGPCFFKYDPNYNASTTFRSPNCAPCHGTPNHFNNLYSGVYLIGAPNGSSNASNGVDIVSCNFTNCARGIYTPKRYFDVKIFTKILRTDLLFNVAIIRNVLITNRNLYQSFISDHINSRTCQIGIGNTKSLLNIIDNEILLNVYETVVDPLLCKATQTGEDGPGGFGIYIFDVNSNYIGQAHCSRNKVWLKWEYPLACNDRLNWSLIAIQDNSIFTGLSCNNLKFFGDQNLFSQVPGNDIAFFHSNEYSTSTINQNILSGSPTKSNNNILTQDQILLSGSALNYHQIEFITDGVNPVSYSNSQVINYYCGNSSSSSYPTKISNGAGNVNVISASGNIECGLINNCGSYPSTNTQPDPDGEEVGGWEQQPGFIKHNIGISPNPVVGGQPIAISWAFDYFVPDPNGGGTQVDIDWIDIEIIRLSNSQIVYSQRQFGNSGSVSIPTGGLTPGVYIIVIRTNTGHVFTFTIYLI